MKRINQNYSHCKSYSIPKLQPVVWGYIAGLLDGEGHIRLYPTKSERVGVQLTITQSRKNNGEHLLSSLKKWLSIGNIGNSRKDGYVLEYYIGQREAVYKILKKIRPMLIVKREQADRVIEYIEQNYS